MCLKNAILAPDGYKIRESGKVFTSDIVFEPRSGWVSLAKFALQTGVILTGQDVSQFNQKIAGKINNKKDFILS